MSRLFNQIDDIESLPNNMLLFIGAIRTYMGRLNFFLGVPNTFMIAILFYNDTTVLHKIFPTVFHWILFIALVFVPSVILFDRMILHPAQIAYNHFQSSKENRNPVYKEVMEIKKMMEESDEF